MHLKIQDQHKKKPAYIYIRQSTMNQVYHHKESTERQYKLKEKAIRLGWSRNRIKILDGDLGTSGAQVAGREDFKTLVADVSMRKVGAVFALEASRLARSCADWHRLLELCSITDTLIVDEDGCYNLVDFNDQLLLGLKGTMSQAELHFIRARLLGGKINKAKKGELRFPLPVGYSYDEQGHTIFDPDQQVYEIVRFLFSTFHQLGSAYGVVHEFGKKGLKFPKRQYGGCWDGKLIWGQLTHNRVLNILKNPSYAGVYVYGRYKYEKIISSDGADIHFKVKLLPMSDWQVIIKNHHHGYISWDDFLKNRQILERNQTNRGETLLSSVAREGLALLQGMLICGHCGRKLTIRYKGNKGIYPTYNCTWLKREGLSSKESISIGSNLLDQAISKRVLEILKEDQIEIALKAMAELERRDKEIDKQWQMRIERAQYEANLAQRRYEQVDPANRLVASTLEKQWNDALLRLQEVKNQNEEYKSKNHLSISLKQKEKLFELAKDFPRLWNSPTTRSRDKKRMLRLLIKDITVDRIEESRQVVLHIRWQGGATEDITVSSPAKIYDRKRYPIKIVEKVKGLAENMYDKEIANYLNQHGYKSATSKPFSLSMVKWIRYKHKIHLPQLKKTDEFTVSEVIEKYGVSRHVVYYWIHRDIIRARKVNKGSAFWITISKEKEEELYDWVRNSNRIKKKNHRGSPNKIAGGAV